MWRYWIMAAFLLGGSALAQSGAGEIVYCDREQDCLKRLKGLAERNGPTLRLKLDNGKTKTFNENRQACDNDDAENCLRVDLRAHLPAQQVFVVAWNAYEESGSFVIHTKTGQSAELDSLPQFSPSGRWFVSVNDNQIDESQYAIAIWSTASGAPRQEFRYSGPQGPTYEYWQFIGWDGDARVRLKVDFDSGDGKTRPMEVDAVWNGRAWKLNWPLPNPY